MDRLASSRDLFEAAFGLRLPGELLATTGEGRLRSHLTGLVEAIERRGDGQRVELWVTDAGDRPFIVHAAPQRASLTVWCSVPIRRRSGELIGAFTVSLVAGRALADETQREIESAAWMAGLLLESGEASEYRALLNQVPAAIYIAEPGENGRWLYVSREVEAILGYSAEEWCADPGMWAERLHPDDREWVLSVEPSHEFDEWQETTADDYRMIHRDGSVVWIRDDAMLVRDELGRGRWHGVLVDMTDLKLAEAELERRAAQQAAVARLGERALERAEIDELMADALRAAVEILDVDGGAILESSPDGAHYTFRSLFEHPARSQGVEARVGGAIPQADWTFHTREATVVRDYATDERFPRSSLAHALGTRSSITVPIEGPTGFFGMLAIHATSPRDHAAGDVDFIQALANVLADALERQTADDQMQHRALHDALTDLPNRVLFLDRLEHALDRLRRQTSSLAAILFIDLDNFKLVNDSMGHAAGDELLAAVAARLKQAVRPSDTVARFGGDEFGLLLEELSTEREAISMAERVAAAFARPFVLGSSEHFVTTSIGIALAKGGERASDLIRDADAAMYRAKGHGRARYELFDEVMRSRAIAQLRTENDLRRAIDRGELRLAFQPIVWMRDRSLAGAEVLARWDHPERGAIEPDDFIKIAEEIGLIDRIGRFVLEGACRQAAQWAAARPDARPLPVSVNVSPLQLAQGGLAATVEDVLTVTGLDPSWLILELTESVLIGDADQTSESLEALCALGVDLVLDDFGREYSSLSYLSRLPFRGIKIDRTFVAGLGRANKETAIVEAIIGMAKALSLQVLGEGVETADQLSELDRLGCELAQGYHFSSPLTARQMTALINLDAPLPATPQR